MKGPAAEDIASRAAMDERNNRGAEGWSPDKARLALRNRLAPRLSESKAFSVIWRPRYNADSLLEEAESCLASREAFDAFCMREFGGLIL